MDNLPLRVTDDFDGSQLDPRWVGGYANKSLEATLAVNNGLKVRIVQGSEYASAGVALRVPVLGDFDVRVRFAVTNPTAGTTFEVAAVAVDPPRDSGLVQALANQYSRSRIYDVHGVPPYVSSEFDEGDGWRIGWNRSTAQTRPLDDELIADNHFNRYGETTRVLTASNQVPKEGWLRLVRTGDDWASYREGAGDAWILTGRVRQMNLPRAVFLRLAAKHWVKGKPPAPANEVVFSRFELRTALPLATQADYDLNVQLAAGTPVASPSPSVEVAQSLRGCRKCDAFWGDTAYGPFLQVGPAAPAAAGATTKAATATIRGFAHPEPAVLYGCRKAPIMLIGINPNLPAHFIFPRKGAKADWTSGSHVAMPHFSSDQAYARHYRYRPPPSQQLADASVLESLLAPHDLIVAEDAGEIVEDDNQMGGSYRVPGRRVARLAIQYAGRTEPVLKMVTWKQDESFAIVRRTFARGEVIAGLLSGSVVGQDVPLVNTTSGGGYYSRAARLLEGVGAMLPKSNLVLGEDMSLHDAVACASPVWNTREFDIDRVRTHCVQEMRWMHRDLVECAPEVVVLAGRVALGLFAQPSEGRLSTPLEALPVRAGGHDGLFSTVANKGLWWTYRANGIERNVRVIVAPHFSYSDNFEQQCYILEADWRLFRQRHAAVAKLLEAKERVKPVFGADDTQVSIRQGDELWSEIEAADGPAAITLRKYWVDPFEFLSAAVIDGLRERKVGVDPQGRLKRQRGACDFCENVAWKIGGGCVY